MIIDQNQWPEFARGKKISLILPAHNEAHHLLTNIERTRAVFEGRDHIEFVVIDDGSTDETSAVIFAAEKKWGDVKGVHLPNNLGKGEALRHGVRVSQGDYIIFLDSDLDLPPEQITNLFSIMEKSGADVVVGSKRHPESKINYPLHRRVISEVYYRLVQVLTGISVRDTQAGIKLFKREAIEFAMARMLIKRFAFDLELLTIITRRGYTIKEAPILLEYQQKWGRIGMAAIWNILIDTLAIFYRARILKYYRRIPEYQRPEEAPEVSVIVPFSLDSEYVDECLDGLAQQFLPAKEVILLPDEEITRLSSGASESILPNGTIIKQIPTGVLRPAAKRNIGINASTGSIIAFLDDETMALPSWLYEAIGDFVDPNIAAVGGPATTAGNDPFLARVAGRAYSSWLGSGGYKYRYVIDRIRYVDDYPSCNLLVRKDTLDELGGFSEECWPGEDTVLCRQILHKLKKKILYDPRVQVRHHRRKIFLPHLRQLGRHAVQRGYFIKKFPKTSTHLNHLIPSLFALGVILGAPLTLLSDLIAVTYAYTLCFYLTMVLISSFSKNIVKWILTALACVANHLTYGVGVLIGLATGSLEEDQ